MLLFKRVHAPMIINRTKTQTRRTWKKCRVKIGSIHQCKLDFLKGSQPFAFIRITGTRREPLGHITQEGARAEGYNTINEYIIVFMQIYGAWRPDEMVWVVDFETVTQEEYEAQRGRKKVRT